MAVRRPPALDRIDIKILAALQRDGRSTVQKLAELVGLTPRPCLERVRRLETAGIIAGYRAVIAIERLSKPITIFAEIAMEKLGRQDRLEKRLRAIDEVVECWEISGDLDYLARFVCSDIAHYQALTNSLIDDPELGVRRITSHLALRPVCAFTGYPETLLSPQSRNDKPD
jgi:Lrp/AsnC family leucine-responsive transcriptional regulator